MDITKYFAKKPAAKGSSNKSDEDFQPDPRAAKSKPAATPKKVKEEETTVDPKEFFSSSKERPKSKPKTKKAPVIHESNDDDDDDFEPIEEPTEKDDFAEKETKPKRKSATKKPKSSSEKPTKTDRKHKQITEPADQQEDVHVKETEEEGPLKKKGKSNFYQMMHREPPKALGTRPLPVGKPNCLSGYTFVISGEFETIDKSTTTDIIKRYGGRVTSAVSGKTTYLLRGRDAGATKTEKAKKLGTKIIDEDGFYQLVENAEEKESEFSLPKEAVPAASKSSSKSAEKQAASALKTSASTVSSTAAAAATAATATIPSSEAQLWTEKYKPKNVSEIMGNKELVKRIASWLEHWQTSLANDFKAGSDKEDILAYRGILISGPPGIGKTTTAHVVSESLGYEVLEFNASDVRSKKVLQEKITDMIDNRTMTEFFKGGTIQKDTKGKKIVLIMDEVDGMSSGDRGGGAELAALIRKTKIPIICICNDIRSPKVQPLVKVCYPAKFKRTPANQLRSRIMTIAFREKLQIDSNAIEELVHSTRNDIRQIINILATYRRNDAKMTYDDAKAIGKINEKSEQLTIFDVALELMSARSWQEKSLAERSNLYFQDAALAPLMIHENYTKSKPEKAIKLAKTGSPKEIECRELELAAKAARAIADGDLVDTMIHGSSQQYSLMPIHSVFSCVLPASYMEGSFAGNRCGFPQWLGQNSKATKYKKLLTDMQAGIRLQSSASKFEFRLSYVNTLSTRVFKYLEEERFDEAIELMDTYHLDRESLDIFSELEVGTTKKPLSKLSAKVKNAFTREYNKRSHPILFQTGGVPIVKPKEATVIEDLGEVEEEPQMLDDDEEEDLEEEENIEKDKLIKTNAKKRKAKAESSSGPSKKKAKK